MSNLFLLLFLSVVGFVNAAVLHWQYKREQETGKPMFCLLGRRFGDHCGEVVASKFGTTRGIKNEVMGLLYYGIVIATSVASLLLPEAKIYLSWLVLEAAAVAMVFSFYLLFAQTVLLRKLCSWCLLAIILNILIFLAAI